MRPRTRPLRTPVVLALAVALLLPLLTLGSVAAPEPRVAPGTPTFQRTWERTDKPVADGAVTRTWMWGPEADHRGALGEPTPKRPAAQRQVQYFDKSRMEINAPRRDPTRLWYVTNGLLVVELMTGQHADRRRRLRAARTRRRSTSPATPTTRWPDLRHLRPQLLRRPAAGGRRDDHPARRPRPATSATTRAWPAAASRQRRRSVRDRPQVAVAVLDVHELGRAGLGGRRVVTAAAVRRTRSTPPATRSPRPTGPTSRSAGPSRDVLMQCFERRCLTYTPGNPAGWQVEAGNVGQHYYRWRYDTPQPTFDHSSSTRSSTGRR